MIDLSRKYIIGVMGASNCNQSEGALGFQVGRLIAERSGIVLWGGGGGIMRAVSEGAKSAGGMVIGIMPGSNAWESQPNEFVDIPIFTGMSDGRNAINVKSSDIVIAIYGGFGTLSEIGLALKNGKTVIALNSWDIFRNGEKPANYRQVSTPKEAVELAFGLLQEKE